MRIGRVTSTVSFDVISVWESNGTGGVDITTVFSWVEDDLTTTVGSISIGWPPFISSDSINGLKLKLTRSFRKNYLIN